MTLIRNLASTAIETAQAPLRALGQLAGEDGGASGNALDARLDLLERRLRETIEQQSATGTKEALSPLTTQLGKLDRTVKGLRSAVDQLREDLDQLRTAQAAERANK